MNKRKLVLLVFSVIAVAAGAALTFYRPPATQPPPPPPLLHTESSFAQDIIDQDLPPLIQEHEGDWQIVEYYTVGRLLHTAARNWYEDGQMRVYIPRLDFEGDVFNGEDDDTLKKGAGLFNYAVLPSRHGYNANTSIAAHRDAYGFEFYYLDLMEAGDFIYLTYDGYLFTYVVIDSFVTEIDDWDPIRIKEYPCVTLQTCTPIGTSTHRLFVVGRLVEIKSGGEFPKIEAAA